MRAFMKTPASADLRFIPKIVLLLTLVVGAALPGRAQTAADLKTYFTNLGLSQDQMAAIDKGEAFAKTLQSRIPDEIFVFGAVYIQATPEKYVKLANNFDRLRKLPEFLALGRFSNPPQLSDLKGFDLDDGDIKELKDCKVGDCKLQLPAKAIEEIPKAVDWSSPNADEQANRIVRKRILEGLLKYQRLGNKMLGEYNDKKDPTEVAGHFKYMLSYISALPKNLPEFYRYLLDYPSAKPANVENSFYWARVKFGLKPTLRLVHVLTRRGTTPRDPVYVIAEKQIYSSHYFETALDLTFLIRGTDKQPAGFYLVKAMGSEQGGLTGLKGSIVRKTAVSRSASSLQNSLAAIRTELEQKP